MLLVSGQLQLLAPGQPGESLLALRVVVRAGGEVLSPAPKARPRVRVVTTREGESFGQAGMDPTYRRWMREALALFRGLWGERATIDVPVRARVDGVFPRPSKAVQGAQVCGQWVSYPFPWTDGRNPYMGNGGDADNVGGAVLDALQPPPKDLAPRKKDPPGNSPLLNDRLVVELHVRLWYAAVGEEPCVEARLWRA